MSYNPVGYYANVSEMQQRLHSSEKKRLELERKLFAYSKSDHRISRLKVTKLQDYLREVCGREQTARHRNQKLLQDCERIDAHATALAARTDTLRRMKLEYDKQVEQLYPSWKEQLGKKRQEVLQCAGAKQDNDNDSTPSFSRLRHPVEGFMDHYGLGKRADIIGLGVPTYQRHTLPGVSLGLGHHLSAAASTPNIGGQLHFQDDGPFLDGGIVHDEASFGPNYQRRYTMRPESQESSSSQLSDVNGSKSLERSQGNSGHAMQTDKKAAVDPALENVDSRSSETDGESSEEGASRVENGSQDRFGKEPSTQVEFLTSVRESSALRKGHLKQPSEMGSSSGAQRHVTYQLDPRPDQTSTPNTARSTSFEAQSELTVSGLFYLLQTIEQTLGHCEEAGSSRLYISTAVRPADMAQVIRFSNSGGGSLQEERPELSMLGAVVLQQLQRLSQETPDGCLLPEGLLTADLTPVTADTLRAHLQVDSGLLWERWYKHALHLIHHGALSISDIATLFGPLLVSETCEHLPKAVELLKNLLEGEEAVSPDRSLSQAASDDSGSLSKSDRLSQAQLVKTLESQAYQQMRQCILKQDTLDDNAPSLDPKESSAEKLLRNDGTQAESDEDDDDDDDIEALLSPGRQKSVQSRDLEGAVQLSPGASGSRSSPVKSSDDGRSQTPSPKPLAVNAEHSPPNEATGTTAPRGPRESQTTTASGFNKKAFWGDSDDSISDADVILSPRGQEARADDFDDFYD
ncbi:centrosomal protein kizuna isoform X2 [Lethenteron reissneri]|uniref:centrosomal protein kizuna isoform X2 n=1 Tax=Lethenteron reissneri TaxID=7753 RepID=UPI002AB70E4E|nr:centrosomal protein kizuna isoform X2 [Lethenteron reissneri]